MAKWSSIIFKINSCWCASVHVMPVRCTYLGKMINCSDFAKKIFAHWTTLEAENWETWKTHDGAVVFFVRCEKFLFISVPISGCVRTGGGGEKEEKLCERCLKDALLHWLEQFHISLEHRIYFACLLTFRRSQRDGEAQIPRREKKFEATVVSGRSWIFAEIEFHSRDQTAK